MPTFLKVSLLLFAVLNVVKADSSLPSIRRFLTAHREVNNRQNERAFCPENYSPCNCISTTNGLEVTCIDVKISDIVNVFYNTRAPQIYSLIMSTTSSPTGVTLPADLLSDKRVQNIYLMCPTPFPLTIDPSAFRFTRDYTTHFEIDNCDLSTLPNFAFLTNFAVLSELFVLNSQSVSLKNLPALPSLTVLSMQNSQGLEVNPDEFPLLTPARATNLTLSGCNLNDDAASTILSKIGASTTAGSLAFLDMSGNALSRVPNEVHSLAKLADLVLISNAIKLTNVGDLGFVSSVNSIFLNNNELETMEANTFEYGDFSKAKISLQDNVLTVFGKDVFLDVLTQMAGAQPPESSGYIDVMNNNFGCKCELAWLIRDHSDLLPYVKNGKCDGFFDFEDLNPDSYDNCPPS